jgi:SpoVK/Ycf46/Vps4 family AAA+-type ATPase
VSPIQLEELNMKLHGYVGGDISILIKEAGIKAIERCQLTYSMEVLEESMWIQ